jgi:hypothetical protein
MRGACVDQGKPRLAASKILVFVPNSARELLMVTLRQQVLSRRREQANAAGRLGALKFISEALHASTLIRPPTTDEQILATKVEYFERHGTRLHLCLGEKLVSERRHRKTPSSPDASGRLHSRTETRALIRPQGTRGVPSRTTERLARFYPSSSRPLTPGPRGTTLLDSLPSKLKWH